MGALAAGVGVIAFGVWLYHRPVICDGKEMSGGDTCVTESGGEETGRQTYYEMLQAQQDRGFFVAAVGVMIVVLALFVPMVLGAVNLRRGLISRRSQRGVATITPRPMTAILLGMLAVVAGGVGVALNVGPVLDPVFCEGEPMDEGDYCAATSNSYTDQEDEQKIRPGIITFAGGAVALGGVVAGILGVRARRSGTWSRPG